MTELIFSDIDGTLINQKKEITPLTKRALQYLIATGNLFIPVSARSPQAIRSVTDEIMPDCPIGAFNGSLIYDEKGQVMRSITMDYASARAIIQLIEEQYPTQVSWNLYYYDQWYCALPKSSRVQTEERIVKVSAEPILLPELDAKQLPGAHKLLLIGDPQVLDALQPQLKQRFNQLDFVKSDQHLLEAIPKGIQKSDIIDFFCQHEELDNTHTWAFGDNYNDEALLRAANHSFLMGNAPKDLQPQFTLTADNDHDGIYVALKKYFPGNLPF